MRKILLPGVAAKKIQARRADPARGFLPAAAVANRAKTGQRSQLLINKVGQILYR
jgi:hypothetical protein